MSTSQIFDKLNDQIKIAQQTRNQTVLTNLRTLKGEIELAATGRGKTLTDALVISTINSFVKNLNRTKDVVTDPTVLESVNAEIELYQGFLPATPVGEDMAAVEAGIKNKIAEMSAGDQKVNKGAVIGWAKKQYPSNDVQTIVQVINTLCK